MCKKSILVLLAALPVLFACGGNSRSREETPHERHIPDLISTVPSDALAVLCYDRCAEGLPLYDSTSVLHELDLSAFKNARMALSLCFNGSLVPVLALEAGPEAVADSSARVREVIGQAATLRLRTGYLAPEEGVRGKGVLLITPSDAQLAAVRRHVSEHTSILDAPGFRQALSAADADEFIIFRNSGADRLAPKGWLQGIFPRRDLTAFLRSFADWTVLRPGSEEFTVLPVCGSSDAFYSNILASLPLAESRLGDILPADVQLALALPVRLPQMRQAVERFQDASVKLTRYRRALDERKKATGKDPLKWEQEVNVREIALVHSGGQSVALVRPGRTVEDSAPAENPWRGFLPLLYGSAFSLPDDSCSAAYGGWYIYGSEASVQAFLDAERPEGAGIKWPGRSCRFIVYKPDKTLAWDKKGIRLLWNSNR
ncbi:MAG: hypothetical protein K5910_06810 [Bacteroidales bacterium]|nr:hypothetical protein [Bacteroidales bacterium]